MRGWTWACEGLDTGMWKLELSHTGMCDLPKSFFVTRSQSFNDTQSKGFSRAGFWGVLIFVFLNWYSNLFKLQFNPENLLV